MTTTTNLQPCRDIFLLSCCFVPDELKELWLGQREERSSVLKEYERRIVAKMDALEKEASKSLSSEETLTKSLQYHIRTLRKSTNIQQSQ